MTRGFFYHISRAIIYQRSALCIYLRHPKPIFACSHFEGGGERRENTGRKDFFSSLLPRLYLKPTKLGRQAGVLSCRVCVCVCEGARERDPVTKKKEVSPLPRKRGHDMGDRYVVQYVVEEATLQL